MAEALEEPGAPTWPRHGAARSRSATSRGRGRCSRRPQALDEVELLVDRRDPEVHRGLRVVEAHLLALPGDGALVGLVDAGEDLDEGRLAGAVLARGGSAPRRGGRRGPPRRVRPLRGNASRCRPCPRGSRRRCLPWDRTLDPLLSARQAKGVINFSHYGFDRQMRSLLCFTTNRDQRGWIVRRPGHLVRCGGAAPAHARRHPADPRRAHQVTGLARSTVAARVEALLAAGLLTPSGEAARTGGRPAAQLAFNPDAGVVIGADLGATHALVALTDLRGRGRGRDRAAPSTSPRVPSGARPAWPARLARC